MFGFLKPKLAPEGPVRFAGSVVIEKSVEEVYALLDWADPRNAYRQRGSDITSAQDQPGHFLMRIAELPDHLFYISVNEALANAIYAFTIHVTPMVGRVLTSSEVYTFEKMSSLRCQVRRINTVTFDAGISIKAFKEESRKMMLASQNSLAKLKIQAEQGLEAVKAKDGKLIV